MLVSSYMFGFSCFYQLSSPFAYNGTGDETGLSIGCWLLVFHCVARRSTSRTPVAFCQSTRTVEAWLSMLMFIFVLVVTFIDFFLFSKWITSLLFSLLIFSDFGLVVSVGSKIKTRKRKDAGQSSVQSRNGLIAQDAPSPFYRRFTIMDPVFSDGRFKPRLDLMPDYRQSLYLTLFHMNRWPPKWAKMLSNIFQTRD